MLRKKHICLRFVYLHFELNLNLKVFTRRRLFPSGIVVDCVCVCVCFCLSVCQLPVCPRNNSRSVQARNLDQKCKTPSLRSLSICGLITTFKVKFNLNIHNAFKLRSPNLDQIFKVKFDLEVCFFS